MRNIYLPTNDSLKGYTGWLLNQNGFLRETTLRGKIKNCVYLMMASLVLCLGGFSANAQLASLPVTGYNADVVGDGVGIGTSSTTADVDGVNWIFVSTTFNPGSGICATGTNALPANNQISSLTTTGLIYNLQAYNANNSLRIPGVGTGTLTLVTPQSASNIYLLSLGGSGACAVTATINFTDLTTQTVTASVPDWCSGTSPATPQFYRINNTATTCSGGNCQYMYESNLAISPANYGKLISSITIQNSGGVLNVMGVGSKSVCMAPAAQATALVTGTTTTSSIDASFTAASPAPTGTGGYLVVRYPMGSTPTVPVNGTTYAANQPLGLGTVVYSGTATTFSSAGLNGSSTYTFYVYTYNSAADCGGPIYLTTSPLTGNISTQACAGTMTGTIAVGPGLPNTIAGGFTSLTNALGAVNAAGLAGNTVLELQPGYDGTSANETFPIVFPANPCVGPTRTLTIRPASGVSTALTITSNNVGPTINLNGLSYVTIDGRAGGAGSAKMLSIINTNAGGAAIQFINDAHHNTITYCDIQGQNTSSTSSALSGVIYFNTASATLLGGNDQNTISFCDVHGTTGGTPAIGIVSYGSTTNTGSWNDNNTITDCNIYDYFSATTASTGIKLEAGSNAFTINNNRLYQTVTRNYTTGATVRGFWLTPTATTTGPCAFVVTNNIIGGNNSSGTGTWTMTSTVTTSFWGMDINHGGVIPTSVQGNTISNISLSCSQTSTTDIFRGISTGSTGNVNIGTIAPNIIGAGTGTGAITLASTATGTNTYAIKLSSASSSTDTINVYNNVIGGFTITSGTTTNATNFFGIGVTTGSYVNIIGNTIGSLTTPNSINCSNPATSAQSVYGINIVSGLTAMVSKIQNNTIANLNNGYISTSTGYTRGINVLSSANTAVTGNTVRDITSASTYTGAVALSALVGILVNTSNLATVTGNTIHSLGNLNASITAASYIEGMVIGTNGSTPTHLIAGNSIHSLYYSAANPNAIIGGMNFLGGSNIIVNNMIRLGIMPDGTDITTAMVIRGLYLNSTAATNVFHNSVFIGGTGVGSTVKNTVAFHRAAASGAHDIRNNIFVNNRSNATLATGGKHYQFFLNNINTLVSNYNVYYGTGNDAVFGTVNNGTSDVLNYSLGWVSGDVNSTVGDPAFIAASGSALTGDLHIHATNPSAAEGAGTAIASVTTDFDGQPRSSNTPNDVGADAGNFTGVNMIIDSTVVDQVTASTLIGANNQAVIAIRMYAKNSGSALALTSFGLNTSGTTSVADISNAKVFYTGSSNVYDTAATNLYGTLAVIPAGAFSVTGNITLSPGLNYFWVSYNVNNAAVANNFIDAKLDAVTLTGGANANILFGGDPAGARRIKSQLNGNYNVGVGQTYATLTEAAADLKLLGVSGPVTFTLKDILYNTTSGEVFPITFGSYVGSSATNTVKIVPDGILASCRIESNNATATIDLNGGQNYIIDGRPGSTGGFTSGVNLQIVNTGTAGPAVRFINEASKNTIRYTDLKGSTTVATAAAGAGVVNFGTTTGVNGNDSNRIEFCDIHQEATALPLIGISSIGSATTVAANNDGNMIDNCNIYDFFNPSVSSAGIYIGANNGSWKITNNHVYQTATRSCSNTSAHRVFWITPNTGSLTSASGFDISNNFIGGNDAAGNGTYTMDGAFAWQFYIMDIQVGIGVASSIQNNTITNMSISNAGASFYGFNMNNGIINCGTITGNLFGSTTTNGAVTFTTSTNGGAVLPFRTGGGAMMYLKNNIVSGVNVGGSSSTIAASFFGINLSGTTTAIAENNTVGSLTLPNSITIANNTGTTASVLLGIITNPGAVTSHAIVNNTVANLTNNYSGASTAPSVRAIHVAPTGAGAFTVDNNTVKNVSNASTSVGTGANASTLGIIVGTTAATNVTVTNNKVHSFTLTGASTSAAVQATGIYYAGPTSTGHLIGRNLIHSISLTAANPAVIINGIEIGSGNVIAANNMVRLGIDSAGTSIPNANTIRGIVKGSNNAGIYFNTVYIGGTGVGADYNRTYAFQRTTTGVDTVRNNIFENQRMNAGLGAGHFSVALNNSTTLEMNANILRSDSIGVYNGTGQQTIGNWKGASGVDANSVFGVAGLINPTGDKTTLDLHISGTTPAESAGLPVNGAGTDVDFDGQVRNTLTPIDIGADAGNYTPIDLAPPVISYTALANTTATANRTITATITDVTGVYFAGTLRPRIYYKKMAAGTYTSTQGVLVSGTKTNSVWDFTIDGSSVGGILGGDSIYYFVIAQDSTPASNIGSLPGGAAATNVNAITTPPTAPYAYRIIPFISGVYTVGTTSPSTYTTLTSAINAIKNSVFSGPVVLELVDPLYTSPTETFPIVISSATGMSATNTLTIRPASGVTAVISDSITNAILDLNGIRYLVIDGRQGGTGTPNSLSIVNRSISNAAYGAAATPNNIPNAIRFINDAAYNTIQYTNIQGANGTNESGVIFFSVGQVIGNSYNTIDHCNIGDVPGVNTPFTIFCGLGSTDALGKFNRNNTISNNNIYNFYSPTGESNGFKVSKGNTAWTIKGNSFYMTNTLAGTAGTQYIMNLNRRVGPTVSDDASAGISLDSMVITDNIIGGSGPNASGTPWTYTGTGPNFSGIYGEYGKNSTIQISRNTFTNFDMTQNTTGNRWIGINLFNGLANIDSNTLGSMNSTGAIVLTSSVSGTGLIGINCNYSSTSTQAGATSISGNKMGGITLNGGAAASVNFTGVNISNSSNSTQTYNVRNNIIGSSMAGNIISAGASASATAQNMVGINNTSNGANMNIRNNTIQNMVNTYTGTGTGFIQGISIGGGVDSITGNTISNLSIASPQVATASVVGIQCFPATANNMVSQNVIRNLMNTSAGTGAVRVLGINTSGITSSEVSANTVYGLVVASTGGDIQGISQNGSASHLTSNNMVSLGLDTNGAVMTNGATIAGIYKNSSGTMTAVHNTVKIQGGGIGTDLGNTYAYRRLVVASDSLFNNILVNTRSNATTGGEHYTMGLINNTTFASNYNIHQGVSGAGNVLINSNATPYTSITAWQTFTGSDAQSKDTIITFVSATDLHLDATMNGVMTLKGVNIVRVKTDIDGQARTVTPYIGADENPAFPLPVQLVSFQATTNGTDVSLYWRTASETNNSGYEVLRSVDGKQFEKIAFVKGKGTTSLVSNYALNDNKAFEAAGVNALYYRLKQLDANGKFAYSNALSVSRNAERSQAIAVSPNPFSSNVTVSFTATQNEQATIQVTDIQGKTVAAYTESVVKGANTIRIDGIGTLKAGVYFVKLATTNGIFVSKIIKE